MTSHQWIGFQTITENPLIQSGNLTDGFAEGWGGVELNE